MLTKATGSTDSGCSTGGNDMHMETLVVFSQRDNITGSTTFYTDDNAVPNRSASATLKFVSERTTKDGGWSEHEIRLSMHDAGSAELLMQELNKIAAELQTWLEEGGDR